MKSPSTPATLRKCVISSVTDVNRLLKQHAQVKKMMKGLKHMEGRLGKLKGGLPFPPR